MWLVGALTASCLGCEAAERGPTVVVAPPSEVSQVISEGCVRFALTVANGVATVQSLANTPNCPTESLELIGDGSPVYDAVAGTIRVPLKLKNVSSSSIGAPVRVRYNADSAQFLNEQGQVISGTPNVLATNYDSANTGGRNGIWRWDQTLAPSGNTQVLAPNAISERKWLEFHGDWLNTVRIRLPMAGTVVQNVVPAVAPDTIPATLIASLPILTDSAGQQMRSELLAVLFNETASQTQRQAAVNSVAGFVVGGQRSFQTDGWYILRVPGKNTPSALANAVKTLLADSLVVDNATEYLIGTPHDESWLRPADGSNWGTTDWSIHPSSAAGANAALERISAPMAWGCSTGSPSVKLAIVDVGLFGPVDLLPNIVQPILEPAPLGEHGTRLASVVGAAGNNQLGMAGVMWGASLHMRNKVTDVLNATQASPLPWTAAIENNLIAAGETGASIILWAQNKKWGLTVPDTTISANSLEIQRRDNLLRSAIVRLRRHSKQPLFVLAAGNDGIDARLGGYVNVKARFPEQILVVGGLSHSITSPGQADQMNDDVAGPTNRGPFVDLYAPGQNIGTLTAAGAMTLEHGTSFAVPLAAGVAGLVKAFFPTLPDTALKGILLGGAVSTVSTDAGLRPVLNAYGALRRAAERRGAPLCGNRVWSGNGKLVAQRSQAGATFIDDTLATVPLGVPTWIKTFHGGRRVQNYRTISQPWQEFLWTATNTWTPMNVNYANDSLKSGMFISSYGYDHDEKRQFGVIGVGTAANPVYGFARQDSTGPLVVLSGTVPGRRLGIDSTGTGVCYAYSDTNSCVATYYPVYEARVISALSPEGDRGFAAIQFLVTTAQPAGPAVRCRDSSVVPHTCAPYTTTMDLAGPTQMYEVDMQTGAATARWTTSNRLFYMSVSERNDELVTSEGTPKPWFTFTYDSSSGSWGATSGGILTNTCAVTYRDVKRPATAGSVQRSVAVEPGNACDPFATLQGGGSIAPRISALGISLLPKK